MSEMNNILVCMKECIIITAYIEGNIREIIDVRADGSLDGSLIICADAGYEKALAEGIRPDIIMGDFDSMDGALPDDIETFTFPARKDYTDTGLALKYALDNGYERVTVIGGIGGRLDHTIANIQDLVGFFNKGLDITIKDQCNSLTVLGAGSYFIHYNSSSDRLSDGSTGTADADKIIEISGVRASDAYFSVIAYTEQAVVSIKGAAYPLDHHSITNTYPLGVSNRADGNSVCLNVHEGIVLLMICSDMR